jgi:hypothetical protein
VTGPKVERVRGDAARRNAYRIVDERDGYRDSKTGLYLGPDRAEHHHRQYLSQGGQDLPENLVTLYGPGNTGGTHGWAHGDREAKLLGFWIPGWVKNVAEVPIYRVLPGGGIGWAFQQGDRVVPTTERYAAEQMKRLGMWREGERP